MPGKQVDDPSLAEVGERCFWDYDPFPATGEELSCRFMESRVASVEQSLELAAPPPSDEVDANVEDGSDSAQGGDGDFVQATSLDPRHRNVRSSREPPYVTLTKSPSDPNCAERGAYPMVTH